MEVAVVGGGIAGLVAARDLAAQGARVTLLEADDRLGGKVRTEPFAGLDLDLGPDAFLARRPEAVALCRELGLGGELVAPATASASLWSRGRLRRLPPGTLLGVPADLGALARSRVLSPSGLARVAVEPLLPGRPLGPDDLAVGPLVRRRLGAEAADRLVAPLLGGVNAGDVDAMSVDAVAPQVAAAARRSRSLVAGARAVLAAAPPSGDPVFLTVEGGLGRLVDALAAAVTNAGGAVRTGCSVDSIERSPGGRWSVRPRRQIGELGLEVDAAVLAVPAFAAAPLLAPHAPEAAATLAQVEHSSVALAAFAWPAGAVGVALDGSGFLVPRAERRLLTACSWGSSKWAHWARPGQVVLRASAGRHGDDRAAAMDDDEVLERLRLELTAALRIDGPPTEARLARWPHGFPQYRPGHLGRMARARAALPAGLAIAGAALGGIGLPACIASGRAAAQAVLQEGQ